ncbi:MAG: alpha/beta hydrolase [Leeuwenhoekiella sp.]
MIIPVYLMPGMAANPSIFEYLQLPADRFSMHFLTWKIPAPGEALKAYAARMLQEVTHDNPILIGVSFGGVLVQEMAKQIKCRKLVIISSVKTKYELPKRMRFSRKIGLYRIAPVSLVQQLDHLAKYALGSKFKERVELYQKYLSISDPVYLSWALEKMLCWDQEKVPEDIIHIHGDADPVFPYKYINKCITIEGGTHIMIITKCKWFNENLPELLEN